MAFFFALNAPSRYKILKPITCSMTEQMLNTTAASVGAVVEAHANKTNTRSGRTLSREVLNHVTHRPRHHLQEGTRPTAKRLLDGRNQSTPIDVEKRQETTAPAAADSSTPVGTELGKPHIPQENRFPHGAGKELASIASTGALPANPTYTQQDPTCGGISAYGSSTTGRGNTSKLES